LRKHRLAQEGTKVRVAAEKLKDPARLGEFRILVESPVELDEKHRQGMEEAVHHCLIHNTLLHPPEIEVQIEAPVPVEQW
jgi:uncharacterized OsmC-like protein